MLTVNDISSYFLALNEPESGEGITNLKLQKLCYYAQGFYLAQYDKPLFPETIEAWPHGPVIPELYHQHKGQGNKEITPYRIDNTKYSKEIKSFLEEIYNVYGQFSAWKLRDMTHQEAPWSQAFENPGSQIISHESLKSYFKTLLVNQG